MTYEPPVDDLYRDRVGTARSVTLAFGDPTAADPWVHVLSVTPVEPPTERAEAQLELALLAVRTVARHAAGGAGIADVEAASNDAARAHAASVWLMLDGRPTEFLAIRSDDLLAASTKLPDATVVVSGRFDPHEIELETITDMGRYLT
jgi:hypothetical protein